MSEEIPVTVAAPEAKKPYQSKTLWLALAMAIAAFFPPVNKWISENPGIFTMIVTGAFAVLRVVTKGKVDIV
jgi:hypothetical protein